MEYTHQELRQLLELLLSNDMTNIELAFTLTLQRPYDQRFAFMAEHWLSTHSPKKDMVKKNLQVYFFFERLAPEKNTRPKLKIACSLFRPFHNEYKTYLQKGNKARQKLLDQGYIRASNLVIDPIEYASKQMLSRLKVFEKQFDSYKELTLLNPTYYIKSLEKALYPRLQFLPVAPFLNLLQYIITWEGKVEINPTTYFYVGEYYFEQFDLKNATFCFEKYMEKRPCHLAQKDRHYSKYARRRDMLPSTTEALTYLGQLAFYLEEDHPKAINYFQTAIQLDEDYHAAPYIPLAEVYLDQGKFNQAKEVALKRIKKTQLTEELSHPEKNQFAHFIVNLGKYSLSQQNNPSQALTFYKEARKIAPSNQNAIRAQLDLVLDVHKDYWQAAELCTQLQKTNADPKLIMTYQQLIKKGRGY